MMERSEFFSWKIEKMWLTRWTKRRKFSIFKLSTTKIGWVATYRSAICRLMICQHQICRRQFVETRFAKTNLAIKSKKSRFADDASLSAGGRLLLTTTHKPSLVLLLFYFLSLHVVRTMLASLKWHFGKL